MDKQKESISLSRYIAYSGVCSRRKAKELVKSGVVKINGHKIELPGTQVFPADTVLVNNKKIKQEPKVYLLLNKPKDYITTVQDQRARKTVMHLIRGASKYRLYPVGRLDRNTTGILFFTNDGPLTQTLAHPRYEVRKTYHVVLDRPVAGADLHALRTGIKLKDGNIKVDAARHIPGKRKAFVSVMLHSGRNRIVRRMFQYLGYEVVKLDRVQFAGLTKKGLQVGRWRFLTQKEVGMLQEHADT